MREARKPIFCHPISILFGNLCLFESIFKILIKFFVLINFSFLLPIINFNVTNLIIHLAFISQYLTFFFYSFTTIALPFRNHISALVIFVPTQASVLTITIR